MSLILFGIGVWFAIGGKLQIGELDEEGQHVKVAGAVLMAPAVLRFSLFILAGMFTGGDAMGLRNAASLIYFLEIISMLAAVTIAYQLITEKRFAPGYDLAQFMNAEPPKPVSYPSVLTPRQAAQYLDIPEERVLAEIDAGHISAARSNGVYRIARSVLDEYREAHLPHVTSPVNPINPTGNTDNA